MNHVKPVVEKRLDAGGVECMIGNRNLAICQLDN